MSKELKKYLDRDGHLNSELRDLIEGMSVSIDVSTGDHDSGNRLFGVVNEVMDDSHDKCGVTLLVYDAKPNFAPVAARELGVEAERREFEAWFDVEYPKNEEGNREKYRNTMVMDLMFSAYRAARSAAHGTAPASNAMMDAWSRYIFELEQKVVALEAQVAAQPESASVSTEQAGDARHG